MLTCSSTGLARASVLGLGRAATHLHPTDHQTQHQVADQLLNGLQAGATASIRGACAEALGLFAAGVASTGKPSDTGG